MIIENVEIHYIKLDPTRPNGRFDPENPTWEIQIRTRDPQVAQQWRELNLSVKDIIPTVANVAPYHRVNLKKKSKKRSKTNNNPDGSFIMEPSQPVTVVNGHLQSIDPNTIGNGSMANVRVFMREYRKDGESHASFTPVLMSLQLVKHLMYTPKFDPADEFAMAETEVVPDTSNVDPNFDEAQVQEPATPAMGTASNPMTEKTAPPPTIVSPPATQAVAAPSPTVASPQVTSAPTVASPSPSPAAPVVSADTPTDDQVAQAMALLAARQASEAVEVIAPVADDDGEVY